MGHDNLEEGVVKGIMDAVDLSVTHPYTQVFQKFDTALPIAMDSGGTLTKLVYYSSAQDKFSEVSSGDQNAKEAQPNELSVQNENRARLHLIMFENAYFDTCLDFIKDHLKKTETKVINATGGGAYRLGDVIEKKFGLRVTRSDEKTCLVKGCNFVLRNIPDEAFMYVKDSEFKFQNTQPDIFPYLLVNMGSSVGFIKVESEDNFEYVGGSIISGRTFWGLGKLLTKAKNFDELLQLASKGQHKKVDLLVEDIYPGSYNSYTGDIVASSFGKTATTDEEFSKEELATSLLHMIMFNLAQLSSLQARQHNISRVYFGGFFFKRHYAAMQAVSNFFALIKQSNIQVLFLRHAGYLGAIGALLEGAEEDILK